VFSTIFLQFTAKYCSGVQSDIWNEGLCPDVVTLNRLAKVGRANDAAFMEMTSRDTIPEILNQLQVPQC